MALTNVRSVNISFYQKCWFSSLNCFKVLTIINSHDGLSFKTVAVIHVTVVYIKIYMVAAIYSTKVNVYNEV